LSIYLSPRVLPWLALGAFGLVFFFTFLPWIRIRSPFSLSVAQEAWEAAFGTPSTPANVLLILYLLLMILVVLVTIAAALMPLFAHSLSPTLQGLASWRWGLVAALALLAFLFLILQLLIGLRKEQDPGAELVYRTFFVTLTVFLHLAGIICALLTFRGDLRRDRPIPRIDILW
jgi:hypothetical protein